MYFLCSVKLTQKNFHKSFHRHGGKGYKMLYVFLNTTHLNVHKGSTQIYKGINLNLI